MNFNYHQPTEIRFGRGRVKELGEVAARYSKKIVLVTVPVFDAIKPWIENARKCLENEGIEVFHFDGVVPNLTTDSIDTGTEMARTHHIDVVVGFGGGSSMDTAKAIAIGATHEGTAWDYLYFKKRTY